MAKFNDRNRFQKKAFEDVTYETEYYNQFSNFYTNVPIFDWKNIKIKDTLTEETLIQTIQNLEIWFKLKLDRTTILSKRNKIAGVVEYSSGYVIVFAKTERHLRAIRKNNNDYDDYPIGSRNIKSVLISKEFKERKEFFKENITVAINKVTALEDI